ncbi:MAG: VOC family protein [Ignavibacteriales bacterium]|nr:VOC family protein [Ignavibacteriales bacterium]
MSILTNPVDWFEIPVSDLKRAKDFYEHVLGVRLSLHDFGNLQMAWFPTAEGAPGATGTLVRAKTYEPSHAGSMVYFAVDDVDAALQRVEQKGGKVVNPKTRIGEFGFVGHFEDTEGNRVAIHSKQ